ncbi:MAG TPA: GNAT family N-acetyltransferase [Methylocella sp.]|nr:GNAT family N-acetyltransferase [Methylocella sp.]
MKQDNKLIRGPEIDPLIPTIFHEQWWLDIATEGRFDIVKVMQAGKTVGWLPYFPRSKFGVQYSVNPSMVHYIGPAIDEGDGSQETRFLKRLEITRELIARLPAASVYRYKCHRGLTDAVAFQAERFSTSVQFTYEIQPRPPDILWNALRHKKRSKIRRAKEVLTTIAIDDPELYWSFYENNLKQRGIRDFYYDKVTTCRLIEACFARGCGRIYAAKDAVGSLVAAVFCVWDPVSAYYFMATRRVDAHGGAVSLLAWEAMQDAAQRGLIFDFDGLTNRESILFFTEFGGTLSPRYIVTRKTFIGHIGLELSERFHGKNYFC